jgi:putative phosphoribosyl transferase
VSEPQLFQALIDRVRTGNEQAAEELVRRYEPTIRRPRLRWQLDTMDICQSVRASFFRWVGYFGASTGGGAALVAAAERPNLVGAVVSRGGRPDLAGPALLHVRAATLLIVGGNDGPVIEMNREAMMQLRSGERLEIVPGASHLFEEPETLEAVAQRVEGWFRKHLATVAAE